MEYEAEVWEDWTKVTSNGNKGVKDKLQTFK